MKNQKNITDRKELTAFFKKGNLPDENAFKKLIDSTFNKADDRLDIDNEDGLMIYPSDKERLISFFENKNKEKATWALFISKKDTGGISINNIVQTNQKENPEQEKVEAPALFLQRDGGKVGLGTDSPSHKLEVKGIIASEGRVGNHLETEKGVDADGKWHNVFSPEGLTGCNAFEIMAYAEGEPGAGRYSLMHAIAISTFGNSRPKITKTCAHQGKWWNKIDIRWESRPSKIETESDDNKKKLVGIARWWNNVMSKNTLKYNLQLKTGSHYGEGKKIYYTVSVLWNNDIRKEVTHLKEIDETIS
ncbi:MAG TPA: hypothetical protein DCR40_05920 [Prolixibacteraceae bacterium]|nr:hypothetical protein [Prolixibacteraceae bacterium]